MLFSLIFSWELLQVHVVTFKVMVEAETYQKRLYLYANLNISELLYLFHDRL